MRQRLNITAVLLRRDAQVKFKPTPELFTERDLIRARGNKTQIWKHWNLEQQFEQTFIGSTVGKWSATRAPRPGLSCWEERGKDNFAQWKAFGRHRSAAIRGTWGSQRMSNHSSHNRGSVKWWTQTTGQPHGEESRAMLDLCVGGLHAVNDTVRG